MSEQGRSVGSPREARDMANWSARIGGLSREARGGAAVVAAIALMVLGGFAPAPVGRLIYLPALALMPPPLNIGTPENPIYEGTPVDFMAIPMALVANFLFWALGVFLLLQLIARRRT